MTNDSATPETFSSGLVTGIIGKFRYSANIEDPAATSKIPHNFVTSIKPGSPITAIATNDIPVDKTLDGVRLQGDAMSKGVGVAVK